MKPVNDIFADIVKKVSKRYGSNVSFLFGDCLHKQSINFMG